MLSQGEFSSFGMQFLETIEFEGMSGGIAWLSVPDKFRETWLNSHYGDLLRKAFSTVLGSAFEDYKVRLRAVSAPVPEMKFPNPVPAVVKQAAKQAAQVKRVKKKATLGSPMYAGYTFENFVEGSCNSLALKACLTVVEKPGDLPMNPLLVYGASGLGKTHLLQAVAARLTAKNPEMRVVYRQAYDFLRDTMSIVEASVAKEWAKRDELKEKFRQLYSECDLLLIDDIQLLKSGVYSQEILAKMINSLRNSGKQVILSCDRHPASFKKLAAGEKPSRDASVPQLTSVLLNHLENCVAVGRARLEYAYGRHPHEIRTPAVRKRRPRRNLQVPFHTSARQLPPHRRRAQLARCNAQPERCGIEPAQH